MHLGVNVAIFNDKRILLTKREDFEVWCLPGGHVEPGESLAQAAVRETFEETGLQVRLTGLVGVYSRPGWYDGTYHVCLFVGEIVGGGLILQSAEVIDARYFALAELPAEMLLGHRQRVLDAFAGIGGSVARTETYPWPFGPNTSRAEIYRLKDESGLAGAAFYARYAGFFDDEQHIITDVDPKDT